jgi:uncharacterized protein (TIGR00251 family)
VISDAPDGAVIDIKVIPRAGRTMIAGTRDNALLIRLAAAPVEGAANAELIALLSDVLDLPKRNFVVIAGERSRNKKIKVLGATADALRTRLQPEGK